VSDLVVVNAWSAPGVERKRDGTNLSYRTNKSHLLNSLSFPVQVYPKAIRYHRVFTIVECLAIIFTRDVSNSHFAGSNE
jgi:hypothetical protein